MLVTVPLALTLLSGCGSRGSEFIRTCEDALRYRVADRRTYSRLSSSDRSERLTAEAFRSRYRELNRDDYFLSANAMRTRNYRSERWIGTIEYRAGDRNFQPKEGAATCEYLVPDKGERSFRRENVHVNGETHARWWVRTRKP